MKGRIGHALAVTCVAGIAAATPAPATAITPLPDDLPARLAVQADAAKLASRASERAPKSFAGLYIGRGGTIRVGFTDDAEANLAALKRVARFPGRLRAFRADYTSAQLRAAHSRVSAGLDGLQQAGIKARTVSTAIARNRVKVGVTRLSEANRRQLARRFGGAVVPVSLKTVRPASRSFSYPPLKGGADYRLSSGPRGLPMHLWVRRIGSGERLPAYRRSLRTCELGMAARRHLHRPADGQLVSQRQLRGRGEDTDQTDRPQQPCLHQRQQLASHSRS